MRTSPPPGARFTTATASPFSPRPSPPAPPHLQFTSSTMATPGRAGVFLVTATPAQMADVVTLRKCPGRLSTCKSSQKSVATSKNGGGGGAPGNDHPQNRVGGPSGWQARLATASRESAGAGASGHARDGSRCDAEETPESSIASSVSDEDDEADISKTVPLTRYSFAINSSGKLEALQM